MAYDEQTWHDLPATDTEIDALRLGHMESGINGAAAVADAAYNAVQALIAMLGAPNGIAQLGSDGKLKASQTPAGGGGGGGGTARSIDYDPSTSTGGDEFTPPIDADNMQDAIDILNREITDRCQYWYLLGQRDALQRVYPLANAQPTAAPNNEGTIPGLVAMPAGAATVGQKLTVTAIDATNGHPTAFGYS